MHPRLTFDAEPYLRFAKWTLVCWVILFWNLGSPSLMDPDEAHYAQLTREMLQAGSWMVPLLDGRPYIDKPVLFHWMQAAFVWLLGEIELAMRLPSALGAVALFATTRWLGTQLFGPMLGVRAWLMLATVPLTFALGSLGIFDMVFTAFLFGAVASLTVAALRERPRLQYVAYALLILAVMTKGPVALILVALFFAGGTLCGPECRKGLLSLRWGVGLATVVFGSAPWFLWMWLKFDSQFIQQYFVVANLHYVTQPISFSSREFNHTLYLTTFLAGFFPWSVLLIGGGFDTVRRWRSGIAVAPEERLLWLWIGVTFVFFTLARFKVDRYVYPAAPACCLLAAHTWLGISTARQKSSAGSAIGAKIAAMALGVCLIVVGLAAALFLFHLGIDLPPVAAIIPASLLAGGVGLGATIIRKRAVSPQLFSFLLVMMVIVYGTAVNVGFPVLERVRPTARVARSLSSRLAAEDRVGLYRVDKWHSSLRYYLMRPVTTLETPAEVRAFLDAPGGRAYVVLVRDDVDRLREEGITLMPVSARAAVTGTTGRGLRQQRWSALIVATE